MTGDLDMKKIAIPNNAVRCIIMTPKAKAGVNDIINQLHQFGDEPTVICGQYDDEQILAAAMINKALGSKNKSKIGVKDETMAGIVFISANGRVITADTMSIDIAA